MMLPGYYYYICISKWDRPLMTTAQVAFAVLVAHGQHAAELHL